MKFDISVRSNSTISSSPERDSSGKAGDSPPKSAFGRLCRRLSPKMGGRSRAPSSASSISGGDNFDPEDCVNSGELRRVFDYFDENGDGRISPAELLKCVRSMGGEMSSEEAEMAVRSSDLDGDGLLGFEEFEKLLESGGEEEKKRDLRQAFGMYEMDGSGCITASSLKRMLSRLGEPRSVEDCKAMIRAFDLNGDGVLSFDEFRVMMR